MYICTLPPYSIHIFHLASPKPNTIFLCSFTLNYYSFLQSLFRLSCNLLSRISNKEGLRLHCIPHRQQQSSWKYHPTGFSLLFPSRYIFSFQLTIAHNHTNTQKHTVPPLSLTFPTPHKKTDHLLINTNLKGDKNLCMFSSFASLSLHFNSSRNIFAFNSQLNSNIFNVLCFLIICCK